MLNQRVHSEVTMTSKPLGARDARPSASSGRSVARKVFGSFEPVLLLALLLLSPGVAQANGPLAYVTNSNDNTVSVIATASNTVTATVPVGAAPFGVAVTPDGAHVYVGNFGDNTVSVIATASNTVTATVPVGVNPLGIAVTPDGAHVYVGNFGDNTVSVIATATDTVTVTVPVGASPQGVAVMPDGAHVYVANQSDNTISVIATASNTVTATVSVGADPLGIAVTPDGAQVYAANFFGNTVSVIATAGNTVTATVPAGGAPMGLSVAPDGAHVYVADGSDNTVSVIATASNTLTATVPVGGSPVAFGQFVSAGVTPPHVTFPFASFTARVEIERPHRLTKRASDSFEVEGGGVLNQASGGIAPKTADVTLSLGALSLTIPAGSFVATMDRDEANDEGRRDRDRDTRRANRHGADRDAREDRDDRDDVVTAFHFKGVIAGVSLDVTIQQGPKHTFRFQFEGWGANLGLVVNPMTVGLAIGQDVGHLVVKADIDR
jgi:YVTN family beta-propeller protein